VRGEPGQAGVCNGEQEGGLSDKDTGNDTGPGLVLLTTPGLSPETAEELMLGKGAWIALGDAGSTAGSLSRGTGQR
jgi:hypothetical protein